MDWETLWMLFLGGRILIYRSTKNDDRYHLGRGNRAGVCASGGRHRVGRRTMTHRPGCYGPMITAALGLALLLGVVVGILTGPLYSHGVW